MSEMRLCENPSCRQPFLSRRGFRHCCHACSFQARPLAERFWEKVQRCAHDPWCVYCCWPWMASRKTQGYGQLAVLIDGKWKPIRTNRLAWELFQGHKLPEGLWALHFCDWEPCCNPAHLYPGTRAQNTQDAIVRGRLIGRYHGSGHRGEKTPNSRLKERDIPRIWTLRAQGKTIRYIADEFNVSHGAIYGVLEYRTWKHVSLTLNAAKT